MSPNDLKTLEDLIKTIQDEISKNPILEGEMLTIDHEIGNKTVRDNLELLNGVLKRDIFPPDYICKVKAAFEKKIQEQNDLENTSLVTAPNKIDQEAEEQNNLEDKSSLLANTINTADQEMVILPFLIAVESRELSCQS